MIKRNYLSIFALFLAASVTLTACDTNEADDTTQVVETEVTITETTLDASDPVVQDIVTSVASGDAGAILGDNVAVDTSAGAVTQVTAVATSTSGAQTTTTSTIAPVVNTTTGQPTNSAVVVAQINTTSNSQSQQTQTVVSTPNVANTSNIVVATTNADTGGQADLNLNSTFDVSAMSSNSDPVWASRNNSVRQAFGAAGTSFASAASGSGQTWAQQIQADLAAGKRRTLITTLAGYQAYVYTTTAQFGIDAVAACAANSSVLEVTVTVGSVDWVADCSFARTFGVVAPFPR